MEDALAPSDATEDAVQALFLDRLRSSSYDLAEHMRASLATVTYNTCRDDPQGAALTFVLYVFSALDRHNAAEVFRNG